MCCASRDCTDEPYGFCPDCGQATQEGDAVEQCAYSPTICPTRNHAPCDGSC